MLFRFLDLWGLYFNLSDSIFDFSGNLNSWGLKWYCVYIEVVEGVEYGIRCKFIRGNREYFKFFVEFCFKVGIFLWILKLFLV